MNISQQCTNEGDERVCIKEFGREKLEVTLKSFRPLTTFSINFFLYSTCPKTINSMNVLVIKRAQKVVYKLKIELTIAKLIINNILFSAAKTLFLISIDKGTCEEKILKKFLLALLHHFNHRMANIISCQQ